MRSPGNGCSGGRPACEWMNWKKWRRSARKNWCEKWKQRARTQTALLASEEKFSKAFQSSPMAMAIQSRADGRFLAVNSSFTALTGYSAEKIVQHTGEEMRLWKDPAALNAGLQPEGRLRNHSCVLLRQDAEERQDCALFRAAHGRRPAVPAHRRGRRNRKIETRSADCARPKNLRSSAGWWPVWPTSLITCWA